MDIYTVEEAKVYAGGQAVKDDATVSKTSKMPKIELDGTYNTENLTNETNSSEDKGYYVDIPMWIRSNVSGTTGKDVNAWVKITDPTKDDTNANGSKLINAVRVALIPVASTSSLKTVSGDTLKYTEIGTRVVDSNVFSNATIFGLTDTTYKNNVLSQEGTYSASLGNAQTIVQAADTFTPATTSEGATYNTSTTVQGTPQ